MVRFKNKTKAGGFIFQNPMVHMGALLIICIGAVWFMTSDNVVLEESSLLSLKQSSSKPVMDKLGNSNTFLPAVKELYQKYGQEIAKFRPEMRTWCQKSKSCKFTDHEAEMLYMLIRETKPQKVFEMSPNRGFSTHWILHALHINDKSSVLHSFDLHDGSVPLMKPKFKDRWIFHKGDYEVLIEQGKLNINDFDFLFVDALHTEEFSRGYCQKLLNRYTRGDTIVAIHDIAADQYGGGRESAEVYKYMAFAANRIFNVFTMSPFVMPNLNFMVPNGAAKVNQIRASHGIIKPCDLGTTCKQENILKHDVLFFENDSAPTIFFELRK